MKIAYVLESLELSGGVKDVVEQAEGLADRGHDVVLVTRGGDRSWIPIRVPVVVVPTFDASTLPEADVHVATWYPTVAPTVRAGRARKVFHFCQGYEALYPNGADRLAEVVEAYEQPIPKLLLSAHLAEVLGGYPGEKLPLGPAIRVDAYAPPDPERARRREPATIGVIGPFGVELKGIEVALRAVARLRDEGREIRLERASQWPLTPEETAIARADGYRRNASTLEMVRLYHGLDLLLHGSRAAEGLGLPPFEAMAAGVPVVITDIPSLAILPSDAVGRVPPDDDLAMAREAGTLLDDDALWARRRRRGLEAVREHAVERALDRLEEILARP